MFVEYIDGLSAVREHDKAGDSNTHLVLRTHEFSDVIGP